MLEVDQLGTDLLCRAALALGLGVSPAPFELLLQELVGALQGADVLGLQLVVLQVDRLERLLPVAEELLLGAFLEDAYGLLVCGLGAHAGHNHRLDEMNVPRVLSLRLGLAQKLAPVYDGLLDLAGLILLGGGLLFFVLFAASEANVDGVAVRLVLVLRTFIPGIASSEHPLWFNIVASADEVSIIFVMAVGSGCGRSPPRANKERPAASLSRSPWSC